MAVRPMTIHYYRSRTNNMIHMAGEFPSPRTPHSTQCGIAFENLTHISKAVARRAPDYEFCRKCTQLLGLG